MGTPNGEKQLFEDVDLNNFWVKDDWTREQFEEPYPSDELICSIEVELGCKLPASYLHLMRLQNGGVPINNCSPTDTPTTWSSDHVAVANFKAIGRDKVWDLCGSLGSKHMVEEWGYPDIGVCIADCPSAGHDAIFLDYTECGPNGEPEVVHIDQENDYDVTVLAKDFETFIKELRNETSF